MSFHGYDTVSSNSPEPLSPKKIKVLLRTGVVADNDAKRTTVVLKGLFDVVEPGILRLMLESPDTDTA